jgi:hypothetical protein
MQAESMFFSLYIYNCQLNGGGFHLRIKKTICLLLIYIFILTILPLRFFSQSVKSYDAYNGFDNLHNQYNRNNTWIKNKYNIEGNIIDVKQHENCSIVLTEEGLYFVKKWTSSET